MKWLKRKARRMIEQLLYDVDETDSKKSHSLNSGVEGKYLHADPVLNFKIYKANNGQILEFRSYDSHNDRTDSATYIINTDEDVAEKVAKCLTRELMR